MALPVNSQFGFKKESAWGTAVTVDKFFEYDSESMSLERQYYDGVALRADTTFGPSTRKKALRRGASGSVVQSVPYKGSGAIFDQMVTGTVTPTVVTGTAFLSTFNVGLGAAPTKSATLQFNKPYSTSTDVAFTYPGAMINSAAFSFATGSVPMLTTEWTAKDETTPATTPAGAALASATYLANNDIWTEIEIAVTVNSVVAAYVTGVDLTWTIPRAQRGFLDGTATFAQPVVNGRAEISGTIAGEWGDSAYYDLFRSGAMVGLIITCTGTTAITGAVFPTYKLTMTNIQIRGGSPNVSGPDLIGNSYPFVVGYDGTNAPLKIEVTSTDSVAW